MGILLGGLFGFLVFKHGLGFLVGCLLGAWFDKQYRLIQQPKNNLGIQRSFFKATFSVMGYLAKVDGRISEKEIQVAEKIMGDLDSSPQMRQEAIRLFTAGKQPEFQIETTLQELYQSCRGDKRLLNYFLELQFEAALADGPLNQLEQNAFLQIAKILKLSHMDVQQMWLRMQSYQSFYQFFNQAWSGFDHQNQQHRGRTRSHSQSRPMNHQPSVEQAYGILGLNSNATVAEIKKAYRKLVNQHHPDKLASKGLPPEMLKRAKEKLQEINAAYELIQKSRHFS